MDAVKSRREAEMNALAHAPPETRLKAGPDRVLQARRDDSPPGGSAGPARTVDIFPGCRVGVDRDDDRKRRAPPPQPSPHPPFVMHDRSYYCD